MYSNKTRQIPRRHNIQFNEYTYIQQHIYSPYLVNGNINDTTLTPIFRVKRVKHQNHHHHHHMQK